MIKICKIVGSNFGVDFEVCSFDFIISDKMENYTCHNKFINEKIWKDLINNDFSDLPCLIKFRDFMIVDYTSI